MGHPLPPRHCPFELGVNGSIPNPDPGGGHREAFQASHRQDGSNGRQGQEVGINRAEAGATSRPMRDQQDTSSSRTLSGPTLVPEPMPRLDSRAPASQRNAKRLHEDDPQEMDDSRRMMPPPPLPSRSQKQARQDTYGNDAPGHQRASRIAAGASLLEDIVLFDDGTWQSRSGERGPQDHRAQDENGLRGLDDNPVTKRNDRDVMSHEKHVIRQPEDSRPVSRYFTHNALHRMGPQPFTQEHGIYEDSVLSDRSFEISNSRLPTKQTSGYTQPHFRYRSATTHQQHTSTAAYDPDTRKNHYLQQASDHRNPLSQIILNDHDRQPLFSSNQTLSRNHLNEFMYQNPSLSYQRSRAIAEPHTPSPKKRIISSESASSPFFGGPRTASQHTGRISLPHRMRPPVTLTPSRHEDQDYISPRRNIFAQQLSVAQTPTPGPVSAQSWMHRNGPRTLASEARRGGREVLAISRGPSRTAARR